MKQFLVQEQVREEWIVKDNLQHLIWEEIANQLFRDQISQAWKEIILLEHFQL